MNTSRYEIIRPLGSGNFTLGVFLATHKDLGREVAVKLLEVARLSDRERLLDEAKKMAALETHDNVVQVLDAGDWESDKVFIASEACLDGSLAALCATMPLGLDPATACQLISDSCRGLDHMHRRGLLHLDIRPANILLAGGTPKLCDFGLARWIGQGAVPFVYEAHSAPELIRGEPGTEASDQYAMALSLAHLLSSSATCVVPPKPVTARAWKAHPDLSGLPANVPVSLSRVITRATRFKSAERYGSIERFKRALDRATPSTSLRVVTPGEMRSDDGEWNVQHLQAAKGHAVEVRRNNRRINRVCETGLTTSEAERAIRRHVKQLADGNML